MSFQFCDGFDAYTAIADASKKWGAINGAVWALYATGGRYGGGAIGAGSSAYSISAQATVNVVSGATLYAGWTTVVSQSSSNSVQPGYPLLAVNGVHTLGVNGTGNVCLTNSSGTVLATSTTVVAGTAWHWIEIAYKLNGASSTFSLYIDGVLQFNGTYSLSAAAAVTSVSIGFGYNFGTTGCYLDDTVIWDDQGTTFNTFPLGPRRIATLIPNAAGASTQFTPSSGTNYSCVAQAYSGSANVSDTGTGQTDTYATAGMTYTPASTINAVVVNMYALNPAGDGTKSLTAKLRSGSSNASGASRTLAVGATNYQDCFPTDSSAAAWTYSSVNSSQPGIGD